MSILHFYKNHPDIASTVCWDVQNAFTFPTSLTDLKKIIDFSVRSSDTWIHIMIWPQLSHLGWITLSPQYSHFEEVCFTVIYDQGALNIWREHERKNKREENVLELGCLKGDWLGVFSTPRDALEEFAYVSDGFIFPERSIWGYFHKDCSTRCTCQVRLVRTLVGWGLC